MFSFFFLHLLLKKSKDISQVGKAEPKKTTFFLFFHLSTKKTLKDLEKNSSFSPSFFSLSSPFIFPVGREGKN